MPGFWFNDYFARRGRPFERALFLNCGNGWVEREMVADGVVGEAVGIDYSEALLDEARREAARFDLPLTYHQMNVNSAEFPPGPFDLVVNYAAAHHIAMIDRVFRAIWTCCPRTGASCRSTTSVRTATSTRRWRGSGRGHSTTRCLPHLRQSMEYPNVPIMVQVDPTEAVHSE